MQSLIEKLINNPGLTLQSKREYIKKILDNIKQNSYKIQFGLNSISYMMSMPKGSLHRLELLSDMFEMLEKLGYTFELDNIMSYIDYKHELEIILIIINVIIQLNPEKLVLKRIKNSFMRYLTKDSSLWAVNYIEIFLDYKTKLAKYNDNVSGSTTGMNNLQQQNNNNNSMNSHEKSEILPTLPETLKNFDYENFCFRVELIYNFIKKNNTWIPFSIDIRDIFLKWILSIKLKRPKDKLLSENLINDYVNLVIQNGITNPNNNIPNFKILLISLMPSYNKDEIFEPHYSVYNILDKLNLTYLNENSTILTTDITFTNKEWLRIFKNIIKIGLNESTTIIFLGLSKNFARLKYFEILLKIQEEIMPLLIITLKIEKWQEYSLQILRFYLISGPTNTTIIEKISMKLFDVVNELIIQGSYNFLDELLLFILQLKYKYSKTNAYETLNNKLKDEKLTKFVQIAEERLIKRGENNDRYQSSNWNDIDSQVFDIIQKIPYRGLINIGNTCYMNSFMQALFMTKEFRYEILDLSVSLNNLKKKEDNSMEIMKTNNNNVNELEKPLQKGNENENNMDKIDEKMSNMKDTDESQKIIIEKKMQELAEAKSRKTYITIFQLQKLFAFLLTSERSSITPNFFKMALPDEFKNSYAQQDSSEFGKIYLDFLEKSLASTSKQNIIKDLFTGEDVSIIKCHDCDSRYERIQSFLDIFVNFDPNDKERTYSLNEMIEQNYKDTQFQGDNSYFCQKCNKQSNLATQSLKPRRFPKYLMITLNRFYYDPSTQKRLKILNYVDIPTELHLTEKAEIEEELIYDLYDIVVHRGTTLDFGHYYSIGKDSVKEKTWILFDDSTIAILKNEEAIFDYIKKHKEDAPYILFYQQRKITDQQKDYSNFKLSLTLSKIIEDDNRQYLKEIEAHTKLMTNINLMNWKPQLPNNYKKDDDSDEDDNMKPKGTDINNINKFIF